MTRRDRAVVAALLLVLGALATVALLPPRPDVAAIVTPSPSVAEPPPYREGFLGEPTAISPFGAATAADRALVALSFSGLVRLGSGDELLPDLASSWTTDPSGSSYTFQLRPDARWQDGQPVTAHDIEFTIDALKDPSYTGPGGASWRDVTATVLAPRTIRLDLSNPIAGFLQAATQPIAPAHLLEGVPPSQLATDPFGQAPVGSGPYRLVSWNAREARLEAVLPPVASPIASPTPTIDSLTTPTPATGATGVGIQRIEFRFSEDAAALVDAFRAGQLDAVSGLPPATAASLATSPGSHLLRYPRSTLTAVVFDLRAGATAFRDARARRGLLEALDRDSIVTDALAGLATRADAPIPPSSWAFDATASPGVRQDLSVAGRDLAAGGWRRVPGGWLRPGAKNVAPVRLLCPDVASSPTTCAVADAIAADWRALGLTVEVTRLPPAELLGKRLRQGGFDAAVLDIAIGLDPDLYPLLASSQTIGGGSNVSGLQDLRLDQELAAARRPGPGSDRKAAWRTLQLDLAARDFLLPIAFRDEVVVASDRLAGPTVREVGDGSDRFWDVLTWRLADGR